MRRPPDGVAFFTLSIEKNIVCSDPDAIIDTFRGMPSIYLGAPRQGKAEIIRSMAEGAIIEGDKLEMQWKKPYSIMLRPQIIDLDKKTFESSQYP
jgi:hypothetical protein